MVPSQHSFQSSNSKSVGKVHIIYAFCLIVAGSCETVLIIPRTHKDRASGAGMRYRPIVAYLKFEHAQLGTIPGR